MTLKSSHWLSIHICKLAVSMFFSLSLSLFFLSFVQWILVKCSRFLGCDIDGKCLNTECNQVNIRALFTACCEAILSNSNSEWYKNEESSMNWLRSRNSDATTISFDYSLLLLLPFYYHLARVFFLFKNVISSHLRRYACSIFHVMKRINLHSLAQRRRRKTTTTTTFWRHLICDSWHFK